MQARPQNLVKINIVPIQKRPRSQYIYIYILREEDTDEGNGHMKTEPRWSNRGL